MDKFDHVAVENKWRGRWRKTDIYKTGEKGEKRYVLDMWPYPSGAGLHVGHVEGYTATDIVCRYLRMKGFRVMHPMGWDAFGLPAENYAIKTGVHPAKLTAGSIATFKKQMEMIGLAYDWAREQNASDPAYYKWTQWLFVQLLKKGLAYKARAPVNWCPSCETVLANEQVIEEKCERCDTQVLQKQMEQWFFKITDYAQKLLEGHTKIDWPNSTVAMQRNWIGKSEGYRIQFINPKSQTTIEVFTTRVDTLHGATFLAVSGKENKFTGEKVINPATGKEIPVWEADYVAADYGTGAIMGVPAHDERDFEFATKYKIEIKEMEPDEGMKKYGTPAVSFHLRDWLISRQRYWGTPIPMIWCEKCKWQPVPEEELPVKLPLDVDFRPKGESPIARSKSFQAGVKCPKCGGAGRREVDTMDTFVDSSWYFLRFCDPTNSKLPFSRERIEQWMPVDLYVGGDHATTHLIYARFITKALYDMGYVNRDEPFAKFYKNGHVLGEDNRKMSKRWGNVVNPTEVIEKFGADTLRMYEMFMGPLAATKVWKTSGVEGVRRFLDRVYRLFEKTYSRSGGEGRVNSEVDKLVVRVGKGIEGLAFNTTIAGMMGTLNEMETLAKGEENGNWKEAWKRWVMVLAPFAPFLAEELWERLGGEYSVHQQGWPEVEGKRLVVEKVTVVVQVDGKLRERLVMESKLAMNQAHVSQLARASAKINNRLSGASYREIFVPWKLINFVAEKE